MNRFVKIGVMMAAIGMSAVVVASPTRSPATEGQVLSVLAIEVPPAPAAGITSLR